MKVPEKHQSAIGMYASELSIRNSTIFSKIELNEGSKLTLENVHIEKFGNNTIHAKDSEVIAKKFNDYRRGSEGGFSTSLVKECHLGI